MQFMAFSKLRSGVNPKQDARMRKVSGIRICALPQDSQVPLKVLHPRRELKQSSPYKFEEDGDS